MPINNKIKFLIVITGWNWEKYIESCIQSVLKQTYKNFEVVVLDDGSTDNSKNIAKSIIGLLTGFHFISKENNQGTYFARDEAIRSYKKINEIDVIVLLDGDDQLLPNALEVVAEQYLTKGVLMTYGNWLNQERKVCSMPLKYEDVVHENRDYRNDTFRCTHLRTFKKELYFSVPKWDLSQSEINSYPDVELLFSMMEMCGKEKIGVIYEPIYIYNETNPDRTLKRFGKDDEGYLEICKRQKKQKINL